MAHVVGTKGQVVIAKEIRERLGVKPGWLALQRLGDDHVEVSFIPPEHNKSLKGSLVKHIKARIAPGQRWSKARETAWRNAASRKMALREENA